MLNAAIFRQIPGEVPVGKYLYPALLAFYAGLAGYWMYNGYLQRDLTFMAGLAVLFLSGVVREPGVGSWRFAAWALLCIGLGLAIPARTFHFMALVCAAFFVFENWKGKINEAPILTALLLTAVFKTMSIVLGFAIRLELSKNAAAALRLLGLEATAEGNMIRFRGESFSVDPACMGLQMLEVSFLFCFFLLGLLERRSGRYLKVPALLLLLLLTGILILLFNQLRIVLLVYFNILPENPMHDVAGLAGLALYVFLPLWFILTQVFRTPGGWMMARVKATETRVSPAPFVPNRSLFLGTHVLLALGVSWFVMHEQGQGSEHVDAAVALEPRGLPTDCIRKNLQDGVVQYTRDSLLVYVKPIRGFYSTEHSPLICWQGSGYVFGKIWEQPLADGLCYAGTLEKPGSPVLYTAWWFDNGREQTISQTRWRLLDAGGAPGFCLINVTAPDLPTLKRILLMMNYE